MTTDPLVIVLTVVCTILTILLVVIGVQVFIVLQEFKKTLNKANNILEVLHATAIHTLVPLTSLRGVAQGIRGGLHIVEAFTQYLKKHEDK
jgi:hypothetical protein